MHRNQVDGVHVGAFSEVSHNQIHHLGRKMPFLLNRKDSSTATPNYATERPSMSGFGRIAED